MAQFWDVPLIDISPYVKGDDAIARAGVASAFDEANATVGFAQITGHGVPDRVIDGLGKAIDTFFSLAPQDKTRYRAAPEISRGYSPPRSESLSLSLGVVPDDGAYDAFEAFNVGVAASEFPHLNLSAQHYPENIWPDGLDEFAESVSTYFTEASRVARTLTTIFADALGLEEGFFAPYTDHSIDVLRMNNYALAEGSVVSDRLRAMGEHTDYGIVTVLGADRIPGLQVLGSDRTWHDVIPEEGALLVNLGDLTARWTNDRWLSTLHRVMPPVEDGRIVRRRSAAFFHDGNVDAQIETLPSCRHADGSSPYSPITVADHLAQKLGGSRAGLPNSDAEREVSRLRAARPA